MFLFLGHEAGAKLSKTLKKLFISSSAGTEMRGRAGGGE
jgi:hypothetical protein